MFWYRWFHHKIISIAYRQPALPLEKVIIDSTLLRLGERSLLVEMRMWDRSQQHLKSLLWMTLVHYNLRTQKSQVHNEELRAFLTSLENPLPKPVSFEERTKQLSAPTNAMVP